MKVRKAIEVSILDEKLATDDAIDSSVIGGISFSPARKTARKESIAQQTQTQ